MINKKVIVILIIIVGIIILTSVALHSKTEPEPTTATVDDINRIFPQRSEIETMWEISQPYTIDETRLNWEEKNSIKESLEIVNGNKEVLLKSYSGDRQNIVVWIFKFENYGDASAYYQKKYAELYEKGGYEAFDIWNVDAKCFGTVRVTNWLGDYLVDAYCIESNIFYHIDGLVKATDILRML